MPTGDVDLEYQSSSYFFPEPSEPETWTDVVDGIGSLQTHPQARPWDNVVIIHPGKKYWDRAWMYFEKHT